jgi:type IV pilus assembly protein PilP
MIRFITLLILALLLGACNNRNKGVEDLRLFTVNAYKDHIPEVEPLPPLKPNAVYIYTGSKKVDPFNQGNLARQTTKAVDTGGGEAGPDLTRRKEPLEAYPIDALKLVGVMEKDGIDWAIIRAPDKTVHRVTEGNYMGKHYGEIVSIKGTTLKVTELVRNPVGKWEKKNATVVLR